MLGRLPGVTAAQWVEERRGAELAVAPGADPQEVMAAALGAMRVRHVSLRRTTLDDVFVELVGEHLPPSEESGNG
jgi:ABC-type uncharacterized transport system ATPase subunit